MDGGGNGPIGFTSIPSLRLFSQTDPNKSGEVENAR